MFQPRITQAACFIMCSIIVSLHTPVPPHVLCPRFLTVPWSVYGQIPFETWPAINVFFCSSENKTCKNTPPTGRLQRRRLRRPPLTSRGGAGVASSRVSRDQCTAVRVQYIDIRRSQCTLLNCGWSYQGQPLLPAFGKRQEDAHQRKTSDAGCQPACKINGCASQ